VPKGMVKQKSSAREFITSEIICFIPGIIGGFFTSMSVKTWYPTLIKTPLNPPGWVFGPVWTVLYFMQGYSLYLLRKSKGEPIAKLMASLFFYAQLGLNLLWSICFFGFKSPLLGFMEIGILDITVLFTIISVYRINKKASYWLLPYMAWISFATYLNYSIYQLNK
jgi:tryptophan-rich sensory protein